MSFLFKELNQKFPRRKLTPEEEASCSVEDFEKLHAVVQEKGMTLNRRIGKLDTYLNLDDLNFYSGYASPVEIYTLHLDKGLLNNSAYNFIKQEGIGRGLIELNNPFLEDGVKYIKYVGLEPHGSFKTRAIIQFAISNSGLYIKVYDLYNGEDLFKENGFVDYILKEMGVF